MHMHAAGMLLCRSVAVVIQERTDCLGDGVTMAWLHIVRPPCRSTTQCNAPVKFDSAARTGISKTATDEHLQHSPRSAGLCQLHTHGTSSPRLQQAGRKAGCGPSWQHPVHMPSSRASAAGMQRRLWGPHRTPVAASMLEAALAVPSLRTAEKGSLQKRAHTPAIASYQLSYQRKKDHRTSSATNTVVRVGGWKTCRNALWYHH